MLCFFADSLICRTTTTPKDKNMNKRAIIKKTNVTFECLFCDQVQKYMGMAKRGWKRGNKIYTF